MNITHNFSANNIKPSFKSNFEKYLDSYERPYKDEIIPEYEDLGEDDCLLESTTCFRDDELWDFRRDKWNDRDRLYEKDDVPLAYDRAYYLMPKDFMHKSSYYSSEPIPTVRLIKSGKNVPITRVLSVQYVDNDTKLGYNKRLEQGFTKEEIFNIYDSAFVGKSNDKKISVALSDEAFCLLREDYPLEFVINLMDDAKLKSHNGRTYTSSGLLKFLAKYPDKRDLVVSKINGEEVFDLDVATRFDDVYNICQNEEKIPEIFDDCKLSEWDGERVFNKKLYNVAYSMLENDPNWSHAHHNVMKSLVNKDERFGTETISGSRLRGVLPMVYRGMTPKEIEKKIQK